MKKAVQASDCIGKFNTFRTSQMKRKDVTFSNNDYQKMWRESGLPWYSEAITASIKLGIIQRVSKGKYVFCVLKDDTLHVDRLQNTLNLIRKMLKKYKVKSVANPDVEKGTDEINLIRKRLKKYEEEEIEKAITFLKNNGYKIFKPTTITVYEEVLYEKVTFASSYTCSHRNSLLYILYSIYNNNGQTILCLDVYYYRSFAS